MTHTDALTVAGRQQPWVSTLERRSFKSPAAGAEINIVVPGSEVWRIEAMTFQLVTSVAVANRVPQLRANDQTFDTHNVLPAAAIAASNTVTLWWSRLLGTYGPNLVTGHQSCPLPDFVLPAGYVLKTVTSAIDAADQYSAISVLLTRLDHPPTTEREWAQIARIQER